MSYSTCHGHTLLTTPDLAVTPSGGTNPLVGIATTDKVCNGLHSHSTRGGAAHRLVSPTSAHAPPGGVTPPPEGAMPNVCSHLEGGGHCGAFSEKRYLPGWRCPQHSPAALAGRPETTPDADRNVWALAERQLTALHEGDRYGTATDYPTRRRG